LNDEQQQYDPIIPDITEWPIYQLSSHRYEFIHEVTESVFRKCMEMLPDRTAVLEELARTLYQERIGKAMEGRPGGRKGILGIRKERTDAHIVVER
jgi:hypothetical protein